MTLAPVWRNRLSAAAAAAVAVWLGTSVAHGDLALPMIFAGMLAGLMVASYQPVPIATLLLGAAIGGYVIGNRGFAQLSLSSSFPLLPAELVLLVAFTIIFAQHAVRREMPLRRDALNFILVAWVLIGIGRVALDVGTFGAHALRDFALVYYAAFFVVGQNAADHRVGAPFVHSCLAGSAVLLLALQPLFAHFPDFFMSTLTVRDVPVIFYKGDLSATFMAAAAVMFFLSYERTRKWRWLALSLALSAGCMATNNRASLVGLVIVAGILTVAGRWRFAAFQTAAAAAAALLILFAAYVTNTPWKQTPLYDAYERVASIGDPLGQRSYSGEDTYYKGDNNRFRTVWWAAVYDETVQISPWVGLGFGYDLAARFVREYYADASEDFFARSPHNVLLTVFARMGVLGLLPFAAVMVIMFIRCFQAARAGPGLETAFWAASIVIFSSACFGVVLEGPMGAVVFWSIFGLANGLRSSAVEKPDYESAPLLRSDTPADAVSSAS